MIKKLLGLLLVPGLSFGSINEVQLLRIYTKICISNGINYPPRLSVDNNISLPPNAYFDSEKDMIVVHRSLLKIADDNTIATVLGHELGHAIYNHRGGSIYSKKTLHKQETLADLEGKVLTEKARFNVCKGFEWIHKTHYKNDYSHPDADVRYKILGCNKGKK